MYVEVDVDMDVDRYGRSGAVANGSKDCKWSDQRQWGDGFDPLLELMAAR